MFELLRLSAPGTHLLLTEDRDGRLSLTLADRVRTARNVLSREDALHLSEALAAWAEEK